MSRIIGDVPAHTLANLGRSIAGAVRQFVGGRMGQGAAASGADRLSQ